MTEAGRRRKRKPNRVSASASRSFVSTSPASDAEPTQPEITSSHPAPLTSPPGAAGWLRPLARLSKCHCSSSCLFVLVLFPSVRFSSRWRHPASEGGSGESLLSHTSAKSQHAVASFTKGRTHVHAHTHTQPCTCMRGLCQRSPKLWPPGLFTS